MPISRSILLMCLVLLAGSGAAQQRTVHQLRSVSVLDLAGQKMFQWVVSELDPGSRCSFHEAQVKVLLDNTIAAALLLQRLQEEGIGEFQLVRDGGKAPRTATSTSALGLPPEGDLLDPDAVLQYQQAKNAWIEAYPELYQELNTLDPAPVQRNP